MAFTGVAALVAAGSTGAAITATMVLSAVAEVGMAMTVVGAVTGSKDLIKIGGAMSLIGGVGGMVAGAAGGAAGATMAAGTGAEAAAGMAGDATAAGYGALDDAAVAGLGGGADSVASMGAAPVASDLNVANAVGDQSIFGSALQTPSTQMAQTVQPATLGAGAPPSPTVNDVPTPVAPQGPVGVQAPVTPADYQVGGRFGPDNMDVGGGFNPAGANAPQNSGSFFGQLSAFAEKNKTLFSSGLQLLGGAMKGANDRQMWDERMALEQQRLNQIGHGNQIAQFQPKTGIVQGAGA